MSISPDTTAHARPAGGRRPVRQLIGMIAVLAGHTVLCVALILVMRGMANRWLDGTVRTEVVADVNEDLRALHFQRAENRLLETVNLRPALADALAWQFIDYLPVFPSFAHEIMTMESSALHAVQSEIALRRRDLDDSFRSDLAYFEGYGAPWISGSKDTRTTIPDAAVPIGHLPKKSLVRDWFAAAQGRAEPLPYFDGIRGIADGQPDKALPALDRAPEADAAFLAGMIHESNGDVGEAIAQYQRAVVASDDHLAAARALIRLSGLGR